MAKESGPFARLESEIPDMKNRLHVEIVKDDERTHGDVDSFKARIAEMVRRYILDGNGDFRIRGIDRIQPDVFQNIRAGIQIGLGIIPDHSSEAAQDRLREADADRLLRKFIYSGEDSVMTKDGIYPRYSLSARKAVKRMQDQ